MSESVPISRSLQALFAEIDGEAVLLNLQNGKCFAVNQTGCEIWKLLEQPTTLTNICKGLSMSFDVEPSAIEGEVQAWLARLEENGLVTQVE